MLQLGIWTHMRRTTRQPMRDQYRYLGFLKAGGCRVGGLASWKLRVSIEYVSRKQGKNSMLFYDLILEVACNIAVVKVVISSAVFYRDPNDTHWDFKP